MRSLSMPSLFTTGILTFSSFAFGGDFDHSHAAFTGVLTAVVKNERVDYKALKKDGSALNGYINSLGAVKEADFRAWTKEQRLAFLINLYNSSAIKLVLDHYPVDSIKDIGGFLSGPFDQSVVPLFGKKVTLNHIEHELIRPNYAEPRVHLALVCAAVGCPPLRAEAFTAARLVAQMEEQGRIFFATPSKNRVDMKGGVLYLSPIFKWFSKDFTSAAGSLEKFVAPYFDEALRPAILSGKLKIKYTKYDWSLNDR